MVVRAVVLTALVTADSTRTFRSLVACTKNGAKAISRPVSAKVSYDTLRCKAAELSALAEAAARAAPAASRGFIA